MKQLFLGIITFLFVCGPVFNSIGPWLDVIPVVAIFAIVLDQIWAKGSIFLIVQKTGVLILLLLAFLIVLFSLILDSSPDAFPLFMRTFFKPVRIFVTIWGGVALVHCLSKIPIRYPLVFCVCYSVCFAIALHGGIMFAQYFSPSFKDWTYSFTTSGEFRSSFEYNFRVGGLSGTSGGAMLSFLQVLGGVFGFSALFYADQKMRISLFFKLFIFFLILVSIASSLLAGRTGIMLFLLAFPIYVCIQNKGINKLKWTILSCVGVLLFALSLLVLYGVAINGMWSEKTSGMGALSYTMNRNLDFLVGDANGSLSTVQSVSTMINLPTDGETLLFGQPGEEFLRTSGSDIGYIRNLWGFGIFGMVLYLAPMFVWLFRSIRLQLNSRDYDEFFVLGLLWCVISLTLLAHCKEQACYARMLLSCMGLALGLYFVSTDCRLALVHVAFSKCSRDAQRATP